MGNCFGYRNSDPYLLEEDEHDTYVEETDVNYNNELLPPVPSYYLTPELPISASELTEEEQIQIIKRIHTLQSLPFVSYIPVDRKKLYECIICMIDLKIGDEVRYLPCMHTYHRKCIDEWLMRSFSCPICLLALENETFQLPV